MVKGKWVGVAFVVAITGALLPVYFMPKINPDMYRHIQKETRKDIVQNEVQPGGMKIWSDPFDRKK